MTEPDHIDAAGQLSLFEPADRPAGRAIRQASSELPRLAVEMIEVMGEQATMQLINEMGGLYIKVPGWPLKRASSRYQRLEEIVGPDAAQRFAERWGNVEIQVPKCARAMRLVRDRDIVRRYEASEPVQEICRRHGVGERHFWRIVKRDV